MSVATSTDVFWSEPPPLVMRSSEGVLLGEWPCSFTQWHNNIQVGQGWSTWVYTLVDVYDRVCYVGQTGHLPRRLKQHARTKTFAWWYAFGTRDWRRDEAAHIELCQPYLLNDGSECAPPSRARMIRQLDVMAGDR